MPIDSKFTSGKFVGLIYGNVAQPGIGTWLSGTTATHTAVGTTYVLRAGASHAVATDTGNRKARVYDVTGAAAVVSDGDVGAVKGGELTIFGDTSGVNTVAANSVVRPEISTANDAPRGAFMWVILKDSGL